MSHARLTEAAVLALSALSNPPRLLPHLWPAVRQWSHDRAQLLGWGPHLRRTVRLVEHRVAGLKARRTVLVLGSASLFEVPLEFLASTFERVILVDAVHLVPARWRVRKLGNVELVWADACRNEDLVPAILEAVLDLDLIISLNIPSRVAAAGRDGLGQQMIAAHLAALSACKVPVLLATELSYAEFDLSGRMLKHRDLVLGYPMPRAEQCWIRPADLRGGDGGVRRGVHTFGVYPDWHEACRSKAGVPQNLFAGRPEPTRLSASLVP